MATARDELEEVSKSPIQQFAQELKEKRAREEEALPTIREVLAEIGRDPEKYGDILDKSGSMAIWEEVYKPQNALETGALTLLTAARQSGADPEEYLSRLAPYFDSKVEYLPRLLNALGMVEYGKPRTATLTATSKALGRMGGTLPHELEHTLQKTRKDAPGYPRVTASKAASDFSGRMANRFGSGDERYDALQERLAALPEEQRNQITDEHPVFGSYLGKGTELMARLRAAEMLEAARGGDFYQSEMGQALFPTDDDKAYMVGSTLPGEANITPPWSFERTDEAPTSVEDKRKSYARRLLEMLPGYAEGGEVEPLQPGYLRFPEEARQTPTTSAEDLQRLGTQAGLVGLGFAPGAGMADYLGYFPSAQGGTEPSAMQNIQQGNYGTAAMQGLGAMGDLMYAVPFLGATVGSAMKGPRTAQRMLQELPKVDDLGFYSQVEKAVLDNPQKKGTGEQFLAQIQKTPGVKQEEIQYTGLDQFLANKPTVTKGEIQDYLDANRVQVQEVQLGVPDQAQITNQLSGDIRDILEAGQVFDDDAANFLERYQSARLAGRRDTQSEASLEEYLRNAGDNRTISEIEDVSREMAGDTTKFSQYTLPGGENYREVLLTLPAKQRPNQFTLRNNESGGTVSSFDTMEEAQEFMRTTPREDIRSGNWSVQETTSGTEPVYRSSHFDQPNILAHMRVNDRVIDGKNTLFIEEIQSDWHQTGRKEGYRTPSATRRATEAIRQDGYWEIRDQNGEFVTNLPDYIIPAANEAEALAMANARIASNDPTKIAASKRVPDAPFKTTWDELTLKRAIKLASDEGYDQIAFTTGKTQADRYSLSKSVNAIEVTGIRNDIRSVKISTPDNKDFRLKVNQDGVVQSAINAQDFVGRRLDEIIGKDMASEIMQANSGKSFTGLDLDVGGEGMKGFYDKMLPKKLEKIGKKYGAKVEKTTMDTPDGPVEVWAMQLPDDLKETVSTQGQPLFQIGAGAAGVGAAGMMMSSDEEPVQTFQTGGEVAPLQSGYLRYPEEARVEPTTTAHDLERLSKQAGLIGLGFAPGAGIADYLGQFPSPEGGTEPSAVENWQAGNYGTAFMQGLGAAGDLLYAVPAAGAVLGTAAKGPRTAQKMLRELGFKEDIPREEWLAEKIEDAVEGGGQRNAEEFSPENILRMQEQKQPPPAPPLESKEFKNWFGKSQVATQEGQPVMLYRGQRRDVGDEGFDLRTRATPSFTDDPNVASIYATDPKGNVGRESMVMPIYMKMEKPLDLREYGTEPARLLDLLGDAGVYGRVEDEQILPIIEDLAKQQYATQFLYTNADDLDLDDVVQELRKALANDDSDRFIDILDNTRIDPYAVADSKAFVNAIKNTKRFDGIIVRDVLVDDLAKQAGTKEYDTYRPFADTQVKSAFNRGTYDPEDPRILYGAGAAGTAGIMSLSGEDAEAAQ